MSFNLFLGKAVLTQTCGHVILFVLLVVCFSGTEVCGNCLQEEGATPCTNSTCPPEACPNGETPDPVPDVDDDEEVLTELDTELEDGELWPELDSDIDADVSTEANPEVDRTELATKPNPEVDQTNLSTDPKPKLETSMDCADLENCSVPCPENCVGQRCDNATGDCPHGCVAGFRGTRCREVCEKGYYGDACKNGCPPNCPEGDCHHASGYCLHGCKGHYWGSDCSLTGEFKDNPELSQQKFYSRLSAESKSILLYILMGKYEETLERAQMEITRGLQQRNELRALMG